MRFGFNTVYLVFIQYPLIKLQGQESTKLFEFLTSTEVFVISSKYRVHRGPKMNTVDPGLRASVTLRRRADPPRPDVHLGNYENTPTS